jgi:hypothetical protein
MKQLGGLNAKGARDMMALDDKQALDDEIKLNQYASEVKLHSGFKI